MAEVRRLAHGVRRPDDLPQHLERDATRAAEALFVANRMINVCDLNVSEATSFCRQTPLTTNAFRIDRRGRRRGSLRRRFSPRALAAARTSSGRPVIGQIFLFFVPFDACYKE